MDRYRNLNDAELLVQMREGEKHAYRELFDRYYEDLCRQAAVRLAGDTDAAEDVVQQVFIDFWVQEKYRVVEGSAKSYLARMMHFKVADFIRNEIRKRGNQGKYLESGYSEVDDEQADQEDQLLAALHKQIAELPEQCRIIFTAAYLEEKTYQQVADQMGISKNTVKTQMKTAMAKLRGSLKDFLPFILILAAQFITLIQTLKRL